MSRTEHATFEEATDDGINLSSNAFLLVHGWTCIPLLLQFVATHLQPLRKQACTLDQLANETGSARGPLAIMLRTCVILGYLSYDRQTSTYAVVEGDELNELQEYLIPESAISRTIQSVYLEAVPPFRIPSPQASLCFLVWDKHRPLWSRINSRALSILLDGVVLAPLLTSITYFARWNEAGLDHGKDELDKLDFTALDLRARITLGEMFVELGVGAMDTTGILTLTPKDSLALQRCYSYYVPTSYSPMLAKFDHILFEDASWGFADASRDAEDSEIHVERILNVVGSGAQHQTLFRDMIQHVALFFQGESFAKQPKYVADTGSGDGHLLLQIYEYVKHRTPRGKVLKEYPLTMIGIDFNEESRLATAVNLAKADIPYVVLFGDIGKPAGIMRALRKKHIDLSSVLHVRSFLDHDRPFIVPENTLAEESAVAMFVNAQFADFVHLDKSGSRIPALEIFASLVEHFERWSSALEGSPGLCMLEVMMLDVPTTRHFLNDCVSFHFDIVQSLSRQYMISSVAFALAAAMAGLVPSNVKNVRLYPEQGNYCRMINQHLVCSPFKIRIAEKSDITALLHLEAVAWAEHLQAPEEVLLKRLNTSPMTNLVCTVQDKVVAVLYTQRIENEDAVDGQSFMTISDTHSPDGEIMQLIAINVDTQLPSLAGLSVGSDLRAFALHIAHLDPTVTSVVGVTRCRNFAGYDGSMQSYLDMHNAGDLTDPTLEFHTNFGATIRRIVPNFRPEDIENRGMGVLIHYNIKDLSGSTSHGTKALSMKSETPSNQLVMEIMDDLGHKVATNDINKGFFEFGMDSLEILRVRNNLNSRLGCILPATLLLDYPTVKSLCDHLDQERGMTFSGNELQLSKNAAVQQAKRDYKSQGWSLLTANELLAMQQDCKKTYMLPDYQKRFANAAQRCYPNMLKYIMDIEPILIEVEGPLFLERGLVEDCSFEEIQEARAKCTACVMKFWDQVPEIRILSRELMHLTKQDQCWRSTPVYR